MFSYNLFGKNGHYSESDALLRHNSIHEAIFHNADVHDVAEIKCRG